MSDTKLPILQTALLGWQDGFRALGQMPKLAIKTLIIIVVCGLLFSPLMPKNSIDKSLGTELLSFGLSILFTFFLTPIAIAVHRYVLLHEITEIYFPDPASARFRSFFLFGVLIQAIMLPASLADGLLGFLLFCLAAFFGTRLVMLFPAVAIDGPGANLKGAWQNSSGHFWPIFATIVLSLLPGVLVKWFLSLIPAALAVATLPLIVVATFIAPALASHLYRALVQRMDQPAQS